MDNLKRIDSMLNSGQKRLLELQRHRLLRTETRRSISDLAVENGFVKKDDVSEGYIELNKDVVDSKLLQSLQVMPLYIKNSVLHIRSAKTLSNFDINRIIRSACNNGHIVDSVLVEAGDPKDVLDWIKNRQTVSKSDLSEKVEMLNRDPYNPVLISEVGDGINMLAIEKEVSDIHYRRSRDTDIQNLIEFRIDGVLRTMFILSSDAMSSICARIKNLADLDISNTFLPQDGRKSIHFKGRKIDMRVGTLPANDGEKIVVRLLDPNKLLTLPEMFYPYRDLLDRLEGLTKVNTGSGGLVIVSGPTGSGKTTTNYAFIREIDRVALNVVTAEDPVEYEMPLVVQSQVNVESGLTFPMLLRAQLRNDPDVVLIGEMRDKDTAEIAVRTSDTGHMVFTTLHTDDAISTVNRLVSMLPSGFETVGKKAIASNLKAIINQRLAKKLCSCAVESVIDDRDADLLDLPHGSTTFEPCGCEACEDTGYKGRVNAPEVLIIGSKKMMSSDFRKYVESGELTKEIASVSDGVFYQDLKTSCSELITQGLIDVAEAKNILGID